MKILGIGVDIVENNRFKRNIYNKKFINKIYSETEINLSKKIKNKTNFFAKRFAAKEALLKSLGTGLSNGLSFRDISIKNLKLQNLKSFYLYQMKKNTLLLMWF